MDATHSPTESAPAIPRAQFVRQVLQELPLADAVLSLGAYVFQPAFLDGLFEQHRGRSYQDTLTFPNFVQLLSDALGRALDEIAPMEPPERVETRYQKFRRMGKFGQAKFF